MKYSYIFAAFLCFSNVYAQLSPISNQYCIGSSEQDLPVKEAMLNNGNRIVMMASNSPIGADKIENSRGVIDFWIVCLNESDQILWQRTLGGNSIDGPFGLLVTADQSIYACGSTCSAPSGEQTNVLFGSWDAWLVKLNASGDLLWNKNYGGTDSDFFMDLTELASGNIVLTGLSKSGISGNKTSINYGEEDIWLLKLNPNGDILSDASIGGSDIDFEPMIIKTAPDELHVAALSYSGVSGLKTDPHFGLGDIWLLHLDTNFNLIQQKTFGGINEDKATDLLWSQEGKLILLSESSSPISGNKTENNYGLIDNWILRLDANFNIEQQKTIGGTNHDLSGIMTEYPNGQICVLARSCSNPNVWKSQPTIGEDDLWFYLLNSNFERLADQTIGTTRMDYPVSLRFNQNSSELHVLTWSNGEALNDKTCPAKGDIDAWGFSLNSSLSLTEDQTLHPFNIYPNPTSNFITIENNNPEQLLSIDLLDYAGKRIKSFDPSTTAVNLSDLAPGVYLLQMTTAEGNFCEQICLE
jgi:hypothetical protein